MRLNAIVLATAISIAPTIPAFAHHGWGGNVDEVTALTGTGVQGQLPTSRPLFEERNVSLAGREPRVGQASRGPTDVARDGR